MIELLEKGMEAGVYRLASRLVQKTDLDTDLISAIVEKTIKELQDELKETEIQKEQLNDKFGLLTKKIFLSDGLLHERPTEK